MKILITGGSGFLGSALARGLQFAGHEVALLMRPNSSLRRLQGSLFEIERYVEPKQAQAFVARIQPEAIIHTACAYGRQGESPLELIDANLGLGLTLLQAITEIRSATKPVLFINTGTALPADVTCTSVARDVPVRQRGASAHVRSG
jgi:CDP-paratose synthetase